MRRKSRMYRLLSPTLFLIAIDWIMRKSAKNTGLHWKMFENLESLEYADDICQISTTEENMQNKLQLLKEVSAKTGLNINIRKTKVMPINNNKAPPIRLDDEQIKVETFTYLGSQLSKSGGTEEDAK